MTCSLHSDVTACPLAIAVAQAREVFGPPNKELGRSAGRACGVASPPASAAATAAAVVGYWELRRGTIDLACTLSTVL